MDLCRYIGQIAGGYCNALQVGIVPQITFGLLGQAVNFNHNNKRLLSFASHLHFEIFGSCGLGYVRYHGWLVTCCPKVG